MAGVVVPLRDEGKATLDNVHAELMLLPVGCMRLWKWMTE